MKHYLAACLALILVSLHSMSNATEASFPLDADSRTRAYKVTLTHPNPIKVVSKTLPSVKQDRNPNAPDLNPLLEGTSADPRTWTIPNQIQNVLGSSHASFDSTGHPKASGVHFTFNYPRVWSATRGVRPHIVQSFQLSDGAFLTDLVVLVVDGVVPDGPQMSRAEVLDYFSSPDFAQSVPSNYQLISARQTTVDSLPAGILEYSSVQDSAGISIYSHTWTIQFFYENAMVQFQFIVGGPASRSREVTVRMEESKLLFATIANTIVLPDQWGLPASANTGIQSGTTSTSQPMTSNNQDYSGLITVGKYIGLIAIAGLFLIGFYLARKRISIWYVVCVLILVCVLFPPWTVTDYETDHHGRVAYDGGVPMIKSVSSAGYRPIIYPPWKGDVISIDYPRLGLQIITILFCAGCLIVPQYFRRRVSNDAVTGSGQSEDASVILPKN